MAFSGCASDGPLATEPITGATAAKASYAYSTTNGEMWEVDGGLYPAGYGNPWDAPIYSTESWTQWPESCVSICDVEFDAYMTGLWHNTQQTIHWTVGDMTGSPTKTGIGWSCVARLAPLHCLLAERYDSHRVSVAQCRWTASVFTDHSAAWGAWFDLSNMELKPGQIGRSYASSSGLAVNHDHCNASSWGYGGGGGGYQQCYDYYLVWVDSTGYHEIYLGTECFGDEM